MKDVIYGLSVINNAMLIQLEAYYVKNEDTWTSGSTHHSEAVHFLTFWQCIPYLTTWLTHNSMDVVCYEVRICFPTSKLCL